MKPLILEFAESPKLNNLDFSLIEYSNEMNLSLIKGTKEPAIEALSLGTETFTKTINEPTDSDVDRFSMLKHLLDTSTETLSSSEPTDSDNSYFSLQNLLDTQTITESIEPTDSDR